MSIHTMILERRRALGLTQEQVAQELGVSAPAVHKWEKGLTYPDIALVPRLARLLKVDLNTLFCFQETLSSQEIQRFQEEVIHKVKEDGIDAGVSLAKEKLRDYPHCGALLEGMANVIHGSLIMSQVQIPDREKYKQLITVWYERAMDCEDEEVKNRAGFMAASQYLQSGDYEKARRIIDRLPEPSQLNKCLLESDLFLKQGQLEEAARLLEKSLLHMTNAVMVIFSRLIDAELLRGEEETAKRIAGKAAKAAEAFDCWGYMGLVGAEAVARKTKHVKESLTVITQMLEAAKKPWRMHQSPLYYLLYQHLEQAGDVQISEKLLPPLLAMLESDPEYDFLREEEEFQALLKKYRKV
ncbi:MAG: helix-turn-helix domain-containing protein [Eubacterium sp.]|nr:helix-turn-helix domain-containing protein [Eubacterium sp.]